MDDSIGGMLDEQRIAHLADVVAAVAPLSDDPDEDWKRMLLVAEGWCNEGSPVEDWDVQTVFHVLHQQLGWPDFRLCRRRSADYQLIIQGGMPVLVRRVDWYLALGLPPLAVSTTFASGSGSAWELAS